ncbi:hypothetical protein D3C85_281010 [compost metagenome]
MAGAAGWVEFLDQHVEWQVLVFEGVQHHGAAGVEILLDRRLGRNAVSQYDRIDEAANQTFEFRPVASGDWGADNDLGFTAHARQQQRVAGLEQHEQRHLVAPRQRVQGARQGRLRAGTDDGTARGHARRPREVEGESV